MALQLTSVVNPATPDGLHLIAKPAAAPVGTLKFYASRDPSVLGSSVSYVAGPGVGEYTLTVRAAASPVRYPYYITAEDNTGQGSAVCEWLADTSLLSIVRQTASLVHEVLTLNLNAIDRALYHQIGGTWPNGEAAQARVVLDVPNVQGEGSYPIVAVSCHSRQEDWYAVPKGASVNLTATILAYAVHQARVPWESAIESLGSAVFDVLAQNQYNIMVLDCGLTVKNCSPRSLETEEIDLQQNWTLTSATVMWTCQTAYNRGMTT